MANGYKVTIDNIASDGTNLFVGVKISSGGTTFALITPVFPVGTTAAAITTYIQTIATTGPTLTSDIAALVNSSVLG